MLIAWKATLHTLSCKAAYNGLFLSLVMFPHELKIQAFLIIYCHWERCFGRLPTVWPRCLWSTHLCIRVCTLDQLPSKLSSEEAGCNDDSFTNGPHLITPKSGHTDTQGERLLCGGSGRSDLSHAPHHKPLSDPHGSPFTWAGFQSSALTAKRFQPTWCVGAGLINLFMY